MAWLDSEWPGDLLLVTQNVDDLHERAGSKRLLHMHGELTKGWCLACEERFDWAGPMGEEAPCPSCSNVGRVRPDAEHQLTDPRQGGVVRVGQGALGPVAGLVHDGHLLRRRALARDRLDAAITEIDTWTWLINQYEPAA